MKDKQVEPPSGQARIPVISPVLHCVSMTVLVYLRSTFGFAYLRPKSVFLAFSFSFILFSIYAWMEAGAWPHYRTLCVFGLGSITLYLLHLLFAFSRELYRRGEHDQYSGRSHLARIIRRGQGTLPSFEMHLHLWAEPGAVLITGLLFRYPFGERHLSTWLLLAGVCLSIKEALNYWHNLRQKKRQGDIFDDAEQGVDPPTPNAPVVEPPKATRTARKHRPRNPDGESIQEQRFAELLRLLPPYTLVTAEEHYRALIKTDHPDANGGTPGSTTRSTELNEAIEFFRERSHLNEQPPTN